MAGNGDNCDMRKLKGRNMRLTSKKEYNTVTEKAMAPHSSALAWKIPWMEEPGRLQSTGSHRGSHRVGHD